MAALVAGLDKHGDLMRLAVASPGNDFHLGAMEAPPAVISTYLGGAHLRPRYGYRSLLAR